MSNSSQTRCESHTTMKRKHAEIEDSSKVAGSEKSDPNLCAKREPIANRKGRRACNECRQQKVRLLCLWKMAYLHICGPR